jgi:hypothetical protein
MRYYLRQVQLIEPDLGYRVALIGDAVVLG